MATMTCPSCGAEAPAGSRHCGRCGVPLSPRTEALFRAVSSAGWVLRRMAGGGIAGAIGLVLAFRTSRVLSETVSDNPHIHYFLACGIVGILLGAVSGSIEKSSYKSLVGGVLGLLGGLVGAAIGLPLVVQIEGVIGVYPIMLTGAAAGLFIGTTSGLMERSGARILAGAATAALGGAVAGWFGYDFFVSLYQDLISSQRIAAPAWNPGFWRLHAVVAAAGGAGGILFWFFLGLAEKFLVFRRRRTSEAYKICDRCRAQNPLSFWYCGSCGAVLQEAAPRDKLALIPYHGLERLVNSLQFLARIAGVAGVLVTVLLFSFLLSVSVQYAMFGALLAALAAYALYVALLAAADALSALIRLAQK